MTNVVNKHTHTPTDRDVYIGRGSRWGNSWSHREGTKASFQVATVGEAIASYRRWLWSEIEAERITLHDLAALDGKNLVCFCKPGPCHGDVLDAACAWAIAQLYPQP